MTDKKLIATDRRKAILAWLANEKKPITGGDLAKRAGVSRQVIVQDMSILKAKGEPIFATAQGYLYMHTSKTERIQRLIPVQHLPEQTREELYIFVDNGLTVIDVTIEHAIYGQINGTLHISNRQEVDSFCKQLQDQKVSLLSELTNGIHLHLVEGRTENQIEAAITELKEKGFLLNDE